MQNYNILYYQTTKIKKSRNKNKISYNTSDNR